MRARGFYVNGPSSGIVETILSAPWPIWLRLVRTDTTAVLNWIGGQGPYQVQQTIDATQPNSWQDVGAPIMGNSISLPIGPGTMFLRVRGQ